MNLNILKNLIAAIIFIAIVMINANIGMKEKVVLDISLNSIEALATQEGDEAVITCSQSCLYDGLCWETNCNWNGENISDRCSFKGQSYTSCNCSE